MSETVFDLFIFDLDGTLIDSQADLASAVNHARLTFKLPPLELRKIRSFVGDGVKPLISRALPGINAKDLEEAMESFRNFYASHLLDSTVLYPGVYEMLGSLRHKKAAILTNKPEKFARKIAEGLRIDGFFGEIWGGDTIEKRKPDPAPVIELAKKFKTGLKNTLMLGDSENDILAARAAGVGCAAMLYGYTAPEDLRSLNPDYIFNTPYEVIGKFI